MKIYIKIAKMVIKFQLYNIIALLGKPKIFIVALYDLFKAYMDSCNLSKAKTSKLKQLLYDRSYKQVPSKVKAK